MQVVILYQPPHLQYHSATYELEERFDYNHALIVYLPHGYNQQQQSLLAVIFRDVP